MSRLLHCRGALALVLVCYAFVTRAADTTPPTLLSTSPAPGSTVANLTQINFVFSEPVVGVEPDDLQVNGDGTASVTGIGGTNFTFTFTQPPAGTVFIYWDVDHGITDQGGNPFQEGISWTYNLTDSVAPVVSLLNPPPAITVRRLTQVEVTFSESVINVDAGDLQVNGLAASAVSGVGPGPYLFSFPEPAQGTVNFAWAAGHGIQDAAGNSFAGSGWSLTLNSNAPAPQVVINEFLAANVAITGLKDEDGQFSDWIEIYNRGSTAVNLAGWSLTDNPDLPGQWTFPATNLGAGQYLVVFASGKDRRIPGARLHTNFELSQAGEYLGLFGPELPRVVATEFAPAFPEQRNDYSYGYDAGGNIRFFSTPTPGAANGTSTINGLAAPVHFSVPHGYFSAPLNLILTTPTVGATIRFTTDGSEPTLSNGLNYTNALNIDKTTVVRAAAFKTNLVSSIVATRSYLFVESIIQQPAAPAGYPTGNVWTPTPGTISTGSRAYYQMDPKIVTNALYSNVIRQALVDVPTISVSSAIDGIFGPVNGIYSHPESRGPGWERPSSFEIIYPDGSSSGMEQNCGIQIQGGTSRQPGKNAKHSFRVQFKGEYGSTKLNWPLYPDTSVNDFDTVVFDGGINYWWHYVGTSGPEDQRQRAQLVRDQFSADLQLAMGWPSFHGKFFHVYLNGLYWGLHYLHDRTDDSWAASHFGGHKEDYDVMKNTTFGFEVVAGDATAWNNMMALANAALSNNSQYEAMQQYIDIENFIDYMIAQLWVANDDWPQHNWYAVRNRNGGTYKFVVWDAEHVLKQTTYSGKIDASDANGPGQLWVNLRNNAEFRLRVADHYQKHFFNGGVLSIDPANPAWDPAHPERNRPAALYMKRITEITNAIVAESARWGGYYGATAGVNTNYTRNDHWLKELNSLLGIANSGAASFNFFPTRGNNLLGQFRTRSLYPNINGVAFSQLGGRVAAGYPLYMTNGANAGTIYYTTNGVDPRVYGSGAVATSARPYTNSPVLINSTVTIKARVLSNTVWSALTEATFSVGGLGVPIRITELMYNPSGGDAFEFVELQNVGGAPLDLSGYYFDGITFTFPNDTIINSGDRIVIAPSLNTNAWKTRYPGVAVAGWYTGVLRNSGEKISLFDSHDVLVLSVDYLPSGGWPTAAAGGGYSIEMVDPNGDADDPANWRASTAPNGTPGLPAGSVPPAAVVINEVMAENLSAVSNGGLYPDWVELFNPGASPVDLSSWSLTDDGDPRKFVFSTGTTIPAGGYLVVWCDTNSAAPGVHSGFALKGSGDDVFLFDANTNRIDAVSFGIQVADYSVARLGGSWQLGVPTPNAVNAAATLAPVSNLAINEWLANPAPGGADWLELYNNSGTAPVALKDLAVANSSTLFSLRALSFLAPHGYLQLFADEGVGPNHVDLKLAKAGDTIALYDATGAELTRVTFGAQLEGISQGRLPDGAVTITSFPGTVSPGASNYVVSYVGPVLNEVMARNVTAYTNSAGVVADWVEIFNPSSNAFDLGGWSLSFDSPSAARWYFPTGYSLSAQSYVVVACDGSSPPSLSFGAFNTGHSISSESGAVYFFNQPGQMVDSIELGFQPADLSVGRSSGSWRLLVAPTPGATNSAPAALGSVQNLRINEWMAAPLNGDDWFELYNLDSLPVSLGGVYLTDDPTVAGQTNSVLSPLSFIGGNGWVQIQASGNISKGRDHVNFSLDDLGETLRIYSSNLALIDVVDFGLQAPGISQGRLVDGANTIVSMPIPTPGEGNWLPVASVRVNEALTHTDLPLEDAIELFNPTSSTIDLGGWFISNSKLNLKKYRIPTGTILGPGGFAVFYENQFNSNNPLQPFTLNSAHGDEIWISAATSGGTLTGYRSYAAFGAAENGVSFGYFDTSVGPQFTAMAQRTFGVDNPSTVTQFRTGVGQTNSYAKVGPIVINEIMYHPPDFGGTDNSIDEFIELLNTSGSDVNLFDPAYPTNVWRLQGGVTYGFPSGAILPAGAYALLVSFDPGNAIQLAAFRSRYGIVGAVNIFGPYAGKLGNGGETVELVRPDAPQAPPHPDVGFVPYIRVDRVDYADANPWPSGADGNTNGALISLQRVSSAVFGNEPLNWTAGAASPAGANGSAYLALPVITQQPQDRGGLAGVTLSFTVAASGTGPFSYQWTFNGVLIRNATNSTLTIENLQSANEGTYSVFVANPAGSVVSRAANLVVQAPPSITQQPQNQVVAPGANVTFSVVASGGGLSYQWRFNNTDVSGATNATYSLSSVQPSSAGQYSVLVSNISGVLLSDSAYLVITAPSITADPSNQRVHLGDNVILSAGISGDQPLTYQWRRNGSNVTGGTNATLNFASIQFGDGGDYSLVVANPLGSATSGVATVSFYVSIAQQPQSQNVRPGTNVTFSVTAVGTGTLGYQWRFNDVDIDLENGPTLLLTNVNLSHNGRYSVEVRDEFGIITSSNAILTVLVSPIILQQPVAQAAMPGRPATFSVTVSNATMPIGYQWLRAPSTVYTNLLLFDTNCSFTIPSVAFTDSGNYRVVITNAAGTNNSLFAALIVGPNIVVQPTNRTVNVGSNTTFSVIVQGSSTLRYQWQLFGTNVPTATNQNYAITNVQPIHAGDYRVVVTNNAGAVTSQVAVLTVSGAPLITGQPQSQTILKGETAAFTVSANGPGQLTYQWSFATAPLSGETGSTLTISNAQPAQEGRYSVTVSNQFGGITSQPAYLYVLFPPTLSNPQLSLAGEFQMRLFGNTNRNYAVDVKTNMVDDWVYLKTINYTNGQMPVIDATSTNIPARAYRVRLLP